VLKKAGIVVATAAAGLLAVSPLAFAGDKDDRDHDHDGHKKVKVEKYEDINEAENGLIQRPVAVNICNTGDIGDALILDEAWGLITLWGEPSKSEDRDCYQRNEQHLEGEQEIEQEFED
jgi:hypothetical protein